jgi:hypothetical protein
MRSTKNFVSERMYLFSRMICKTGLFLKRLIRQRNVFPVGGYESKQAVECFRRSMPRNVKIG